MKKLPLFLLFVGVLLLPNLSAQETPPPPPSSATPERDRPKPIKDVLPDAKKIEGLFTFYQKKDRLLAEIKGNNLNTDYLIAIAVARGSGSTVIGGFTYQSGGSDWLWQFRKVNDNIQVVRRNIRFKADSGTPEARAIDVGFSDSILYSLPILATGEGGGDVIDLAPIFMADLPRLGIGSFDRSRSTWGDVKGFANNMEFRVAATYSGMSRGGVSPDPNSTGVTLHYSISRLPSSGYTPRIADQRIGYFTVSHKNFSRAADDSHVIRYINRWNLQKADSSAALSPPKKAIIFHIEKTVPYKYRNAVREGILEWNKAFEKIGIINAIEVRQQLDTETWDAEDINYNTIRWITSERGFAMGPSRVNPLTGEILDADVIFDAGWIDHWRDRFDQTIGDVLPSEFGNSQFAQRNTQQDESPHEEEDTHCSMNNCTCSYIQYKAEHFALASLALALRDDDGNDKPAEENGDKEESEAKEEKPKEEDESKEDEEPKKEEPKKKSKQELAKEREAKLEQIILAGIKDVVMHEVGHTLGLRHNFQASSWLTLDEMNDPERSKEYGIAGSVMDYLAVNIAPKGKPQGDYFMTTLGPYDYLAIEYGYKILSGGTDGEKKELSKIAARQAEKGNNYATDEDLALRSSSDPRTERRDLGTDPLTFSQWGLELYNQLLSEVLDRAIKEDGRYRDVGRYYQLLTSQRMQQNMYLIRNLEGLYHNRDFKGDPGGRLPIQVVDAQTKRDSVQFLCDHTFGADAFRIAPEIYNRFGHEIWLSNDDRSFENSGTISLSNVIVSLQCGTLDRLLSSRILDALTDTALRVPESEDAYMIDELFSVVTASVFSELDAVREGDFSSRRPAIPAQRRALQEHCFKLLASYAAQDGFSYYTPDVHSSRALARHELKKLAAKIDTTSLENWDTGSVVHLLMLHDRIKKLLEAGLLLGRP